MDMTWRVVSGKGEGTNRGEKEQGRGSIIGRHKVDGRGWEWHEKSKNLYA